MLVSLQSLGTKVTMHLLTHLQNNEPVPRVLKQVVNQSCSVCKMNIYSPGWNDRWVGGWAGGKPFLRAADSSSKDTGLFFKGGAFFQRMRVI